MKRIELAALIGIISAIVFSSFTAFAGECDDIRQQVLRLHVLANSDSAEDQELKLGVRDAVLEGTSSFFAQVEDKEQVESITEDNLEAIRYLAQGEVQRRGYDYPVEAAVVNMYFETRTYDTTTLPAGYYDAVRIIIGEGAGKNWWCVMFPPMCIPAATGQEGRELEEQISALGQQPQYEPKFAVVEMVEGLRNRFGAKETTLAESR